MMDTAINLYLLAMVAAFVVAPLVAIGRIAADIIRHRRKTAPVLAILAAGAAFAILGTQDPAQTLGSSPDGVSAASTLISAPLP